MPLHEARRALGELADAQLITEHASDRFAMHDLLQAYAAEQAASCDAEDQRAAIRRMLDHYLHTVHAADRLLYPQRDAFILPASEADAIPENLTSARRALAWLRAERRVLPAVVTQAASLGTHGRSPSAWRRSSTWKVTGLSPPPRSRPRWLPLSAPGIPKPRHVSTSSSACYSIVRADTTRPSLMPSRAWSSTGRPGIKPGSPKPLTPWAGAGLI